MKRKSILFITAITTLLLFGCGGAESSEGDVKIIEGTPAVEDTSSDGEDEGETDGFVFSYRDTEIPVDADAAPIIEALGDPNSYFESESCAAQGIGKLYSYSDFEIETYPDGDTDRVLYVMLKSDAVSTKEGINLSDTKDDVIAAYGEPTEEKTGAVIYETGTMRLKFLFDGDKMISIEYDSLLV